MDQIPKSLVTSRVILTCNQIPGRLFLRRVRLDQSWLILLYKDGGSIRLTAARLNLERSHKMFKDRIEVVLTNMDKGKVASTQLFFYPC